MRIALASPDIGDDEVRAVERVLRSGRLACGPEVDAFEEEFARYVGAAHAIAVSSGTVGLELACDRYRSDGTWRTPGLTFPATWNAANRTRQRLCYRDTDDDGIAVAEDLGVSLWGRVCPPCRIEDACEALGTPGAGLAGSVCAVFGFYPNKQITTGEGGMIVLAGPHRKLDADEFRDARNHGRNRLCAIGARTNARMDEMSAALGRVQLRRLPEFLAWRQRVADRYRQHFQDRVTMLRFDVPRSWFVFPVFVADPARVVAALAHEGIESQTVASRFPAAAGCPNAARLSATGVLLPMHTALRMADVDEVARVVLLAR